MAKDKAECGRTRRKHAKRMHGQRHLIHECMQTHRRAPAASAAERAAERERQKAEKKAERERKRRETAERKCDTLRPLGHDARRLLGCCSLGAGSSVLLTGGLP